MILVSDTHLSPAAPEAAANWDSVLRHIRAAAPDVVIHRGDRTLDGAHDPGDLRYGRRQLGRLPVPWHAVPGNHDVGDNPRPGASEDSAVDAARQQRWGGVIGADHWSLTLDGWLLLAINAQLAGSGLAAEESQWSWLGQQLSGRRADQLVALISHKPVAAADAAPTTCGRRLRGRSSRTACSRRWARSGAGSWRWNSPAAASLSRSSSSLMASPS